MKDLLAHKIFNNGDSAITIIFDELITEQLTRKIISIEKQLKDCFEEQLLDVIPSYQGLTLCFEPLKTKREVLIGEITSILSQPIEASNYSSRLIKIPVCYDVEFAPDLVALAKHCHLTEQEVIDRHTEKTYLVHMLGFLPGFLYLGGLDTQLDCPRKEKPSIRVVPGSIAIGGNQTGIYPVESPGGWHIIGRTPLVIFDPTKNNPAIASPLDRIKFIAISQSEFLEIQNQNKMAKQ